MANTEGTSLKDIFFKLGSAIFLGILVLMLIFTLLRSDLEQAGMDMITGKSAISAGSIAGESVGMDSFNAAKRYCFQAYQGAIPDNQLGDCAFMVLKGLYVSNQIAKTVGYTVSEETIRQSLWEEAQRRVKLSYRGAGYSDEEMEKPDQIYRQFLQEAPIRFRVEAAVQGSLQPILLKSELKKTDSELAEQSSASESTIDLNAIVYTEDDLIRISKNEIEPTEAQLKELYEKEKQDPSVALKQPDGHIPSFEERKSILRGKFLIEARKNALESLKGKIKLLQNEPDGLSKLSAMLGSSSISVRSKKLQDLKELNSSKGKFNLSSDKRFFQDLASQPFGQKRSSGPYRDGDKYAIAEFLAFHPGQAKPNLSKQLIRDSAVQVNGFLSEIPLALSEEITVERKVRTAPEE
ncbi:hypothetical protein CH373_10105 [Leptospira perolatii]|uniref:Uncharacterized protein n=1 Tax=Leptospira perolatii TaxID=2023191 RepID=A0A2M9ZMS5_9LEPT|nr:hypothetical protein [Leptospira perolatii]PJZ70125.1 hypothetical protein CH360_07850 [Leptospira perolatii]PJZ73314.1 hypothetical protein CH373_10105 [Leptospira perolatii]